MVGFDCGISEIDILTAIAVEEGEINEAEALTLIAIEQGDEFSIFLGLMACLEAEAEKARQSF